MTTKVLIADDHNLFIDGLLCLFEKEEGLHVVGRCNDGDEVLSVLQTLDTDLLLLDLNMPNRDGMSILPELKDKFPELRILIVTHYKEQKLIKKAYKCGVDGMFFKTQGWSELLEAMSLVIAGEVYMPEGMAIFPKGKKFTTSNGIKDAYSDLKSLTPREVEVLGLLAQAKDIKEISDELYISQETVSVHKKNIMKKLEVRNVAGMMKFAFEHNIPS